MGTNNEKNDTVKIAISPTHAKMVKLISIARECTSRSVVEILVQDYFTRHGLSLPEPEKAASD